MLSKLRHLVKFSWLRELFELPVIRSLNERFAGFLSSLFGKRLRRWGRIGGVLLREAFTYDTDNRERSATRVVIVVSALTGIFLIWAGFAELDQVVTAEGKVSPQNQLQVIEHYEGGRVQRIHVKAGDKVKAGQMLIALSPLQQRSEYNQLKENLAQLGTRITRLLSEYEGKPFVVNEEVIRQFPSIASSEKALFKERNGRFLGQLRQKRNDIEIYRAKRDAATGAVSAAREELKVVTTLVSRGLEARISETRAQKSMADALAAMSSAEQEFAKAQEELENFRRDHQATVLEELTRAKTEYAQARERIVVSADAADRTQIRSPIDGTVNRVLVTTEGGTVKAGERVVEIVPADSVVVVEARVSPADIGFVSSGQDAIVKFTAYDFSVFGSMPGSVSVVGQDSITEDKNEVYFPVKVSLRGSSLEREGRVYSVIPGMVAQVDIIAGKRTVLSYIFSPITKVLQTSMREK